MRGGFVEGLREGVGGVRVGLRVRMGVRLGVRVRLGGGRVEGREGVRVVVLLRSVGR